MDGTIERSLLRAHGWVPRRAIDVHEYHRMAAAGILQEDERVELIEGEIVPMAPIGSAHGGASNALTMLLTAAIGQRAIVSVANSVRLDRFNEPQPDFALLRPRDDFYRHAHPGPTDVLLLIEVSRSTLRFDRLVKLPLYARAGIPEVWIVDLVDPALETHRAPGPDGYAEMARHVAGTVAPLAFPDALIAVAAVLG